MQTVTHRLMEHPLLQLPKLQQLAQRLAARGSVRAHNDQAAPDTSFNRAPDTHKAHLKPEEAFQDIKKAKAWMSLLNVQRDPEYRALVDEVLDYVRPMVEPKDPGMHFRAGWIFVTSPGAVTPYHFDHEHNFILQIHGSKQVNVWEPLDRQVVTEEALELFHAKHSRELVVYDDSLQTRAHRFDLEPGMGGYMPSTAPHWVKNGDGVSITVSFTYFTDRILRNKLLYRGNHKLRELGLSPRPVGASRVRDGVKHAALRAMQRAQWALRGEKSGMPPGYEGSEYAKSNA